MTTQQHLYTALHVLSHFILTIVPSIGGLTTTLLMLNLELKDIKLLIAEKCLHCSDTRSVTKQRN